MKKQSEIWAQVEKAAAESKSWADFSNDLFSGWGLLARVFPADGARRRFLLATKNRIRLRELFDEVVQKHGFIEGSKPKRREMELATSSRDTAGR